MAPEAQSAPDELPPFSVPFPGWPGAYVRFSTSELGRLCQTLKVVGIIGLMDRLDAFDADAIAAVASVGVKTVDDAPKPRFEAVSLVELRDLLLEAIARRTFNKSLAEVLADLEKRRGGFPVPLAPEPRETL